MDHDHHLYGQTLREMTLRYERLVRVMSIFRRMDELDASHHRLSDIFTGILQALTEGVAAFNCSLMMANEEKQQLELRAAFGLRELECRYYEPGQWQGRAFAFNEGIVGRVFMENKPWRLDDVEECADFLQLPESPVSFRSLLVYPLRVGAQVRGVLNLSHGEAGFFSEESEKILAMVAGRAAQILAAHDLQEKLTEKEREFRWIGDSVKDGLLIFDEKGGLKSLNPAACEISGLSRNALLLGEESWTDVIHEEDRPLFERHLARMLEAAEPGAIDYRLKTAEGAVLQMEQITSPIRQEDNSLRGLVAVARNITGYERPPVEEEPHGAPSLEWLHALPMMICAFDDRGRVVFWNRECETQTGYSAAEMGAKPQPLEALLPDRVSRLSLWRDLAEEPRHFQGREEKLRCADGREKWVVWSVPHEPLPFLSHALWLTGMDVTAKRRGEQALREEEMRYRSLFEGAPISLWEEDFREGKKRLDELKARGVANLESYLDYHPEEVIHLAQSVRVLDVNQATLRLYRAPSKEVLMENLGKVLTEESLSHFLENVKDLLKGQPFFMREVPQKTLDGNTLDAIMGFYVPPECRENWERVIVSVQDITHRKSIEDHLFLLANIVEQTTESVVVFDRNNRIEYANPVFEKWCGCNRLEIRNSSLERFLGPQASLDEMTAARAEKESWSGNLEMQALGKSIRYMRVLAFPVTDPNPTRDRYVLSMQDVTAEIMLEQELRQAHKMETIGNLAGGIAHDFNNILYAIEGYANLTLSDLNPETETADMVQEIGKATRRGKEMVDRILAYSRQVEKEPEPVYVQQVMEECLRLLRSTIPRTIAIRKKVAGALSPVLADPSLVYQIIMNLATNAFQAMRQSGGQLELVLEERPLIPEEKEKVPELLEKGYVCLSVRDTGEGMMPETLAHVFEPFFTTRNQGEGTGLGLATVKRLSRKLGGAVIAFSVPGEGSDFRVFLPPYAILPERRESPLLEVADLRGSERLLVVDDEAQLIKMMEKVFDRLGYEVQVCLNPLEARDRVTQSPSPFDLVITDQTMPELTGLELVREIRAVHPHLPVILCTGYSDVASSEAAQEAGIQAFVMKPVVVEELALTVRRLLDERQQSGLAPI